MTKGIDDDPAISTLRRAPSTLEVDRDTPRPSVSVSLTRASRDARPVPRSGGVDLRRRQPRVDLLRRTLRPVWEQRDISAPLPGQVRIVVPLDGGPVPSDAGQRLNRALEEMWVRNPVATSIQVTSVALTIVPDPGPDAPAPHRMIVMLTYNRGPGDAKLDGQHMARHLQTALDQLI